MRVTDATSRRRWATVLRVGLALTAVSLWVYVPYRYAVRPPEAAGVLGTGYAILFPLSLLLALGALVVAWRPERLRGLSGVHDGSAGPRWILGTYGAAWLAMGLMCVPSLSALAAVSPIQGLFSTIHMTAQHVFLGVVAVSAAWRPEAVLDLLAARPPRPDGVETDGAAAAR